MKRFILIAIAFLMASLGAFSQSFTVRLANGDQLCAQITDTTHRKVEIIRIKTLGSTKPALPTGDLAIPSTVKFKDLNYFVSSIGENAFADADGLTSVSIPSSVQRIGTRAFSGCSNLRSIVFPSCVPAIGEGAFEKCTAIATLSFGSDWKVVDLQAFSDAESLKEVFIPARVNKITGVKRLAYLEKIEVDPNNKTFCSHNGLLYSKDGKTLLACPQAKSGTISIFPGTEVVLEGAFADCASLDRIVLPSSIHEFTFDEFATCTRLASLALMSEIPPMTARWDGAAVFAIKAPNQRCVIEVPKEILSRYQVGVCSSEGVYETLSGNRKAEIGSLEMVGKTSVRKMKRLS